MYIFCLNCKYLIGEQELQCDGFEISLSRNATLSFCEETQNYTLLAFPIIYILSIFMSICVNESASCPLNQMITCQI